MVYKIANVIDMAELPPLDRNTWGSVYENARILTNEYGEFRNIDYDDGGYILCVAYGTPAEELKQRFDYTKFCPEYVYRSETEPKVITAGYLLNNEFVVIIVIHESDCPAEILKELQ